MNEFALTSDWLAARAAVAPSSLALIQDDMVWTYGELDALAGSFSRWLMDQGVADGSHVGVLLPNCPTFVLAVHALARLAAILVPLNIRLNPAEITAQLAQANCSHLITTQQLAPTVNEQRLGAVTILPVDTHSRRWLSLGEPASTPAEKTAVKLDGVQAIVFTSGTTGRAKGAMLTYANHFYSAVGSAFRLGVLPDDRWLACLPLYHVGGLAILLRSCLYGTAVILHEGFDVGKIHASLTSQRVSIVSLVPTMLHRLLSHSEPRRWPSLRLILLGGAAASAELLAEAQAAGLPIAVTYGLTEAASQVATMMPPQVATKPGSAGRPLLFTQVRVTAESGETAAPGVFGEICVSGPGVFAGYYNDTDSTAKVLQQGELRTGDLGYLDQDGDLWIVERRSDLIVSGGENVYPAEVEQALAEHPAVRAICVVGVPDSEWGQRVAAMVVANAPVSPDELMAFGRERLAAYKVPRLLHFTDQLPLTGSGKVSRTAVVAAMRAEMEPVP